MEQSKKLSRSTDIQNSVALYENLSVSDKLLIEAVLNTMVTLFRNIQNVQNCLTNGGK